MDLQQVIKDIRQKKWAPIYTLTGTETFLIDEFKNECRKQLSDQTELDQFDYITFDMEETSVTEVVEEAETLPFFSEYRFVLLERPFFLTSEKKTGMPENNFEELLEYIDQPSPTTILVILAAYEKLDERKKLVKSLKKKSVVVNVGQMKEKDVRKYMLEYILNEGYTISPEAFELLTHLTDHNLSRMVIEVNKLFLYAVDTKKITKSAVNDLVPKSLEHNIFDMTAHVMQGEVGKAMSLYQDLLLQGEETLKINAILVAQFRLLLQIKILMGDGYQERDIADVLKVHPYRVKIGIQQAKKLSQNKLGENFNQLVENEYKMKTGRMDKELLFELFLLMGKAA